MEERQPILKQPLGQILWRQRYIILASVVVMVALAVAYTVTASKVYQATAIIEVNVPTPTPGSTDTTNADQALAQSYAALLTSAGFLNDIRPRVEGGKLSVESLQSRLSASASTGSALVELHATGSSPKDAQTVAQDVIAGFLANLQSTAAARTAQLESQVQNSIAQLSAQISGLVAQPHTPGTAEQISSLTASRQALINQNATLITNGLAQGAAATESAAPVASSAPISPNRILDLIAGLLLGILLGVGVAWARESLKPAIRSAKELTALLDIPVLASIPLKSRLKPDDSMIPEAYSILYANLMFALHPRLGRLVTFVGFSSKVGKTSVVEGLAGAAGREDRELLIVDGDMRAATLSSHFGYSEEPGLADVLQGAVSLDDALLQLAQGLWLLPTRRAPVNAASLLAGSRSFALMAELRERFDVVLIDSPSLSGLADGLILASQSDAVVLVVRAGVTRPGDLTASTNSLRHNMTPIAGAVVFEESSNEAYYGAVAAESRVRSAAIGS